MKNSTIAALGGLGFLAWYLSRPGRFGASGGSASATGVAGAVIPGPPPSVIAAGAPFSVGDFWLSSGLTRDKCGIPDTRETWSAETMACTAAARRESANWFLQQVWIPASRVPITSLTPADFELAIRFLQGGMNRQGVPLSYGQSAAIDDFNDSVGWAAEATGVIGSIVNGLTFGLYGALELGVGAIVDSSMDGDQHGGTVAAITEAAKEEYAQSVVRLAGIVTDDSALIVETYPKDEQGIARSSLDSPYVDDRGLSFDFGFDPLRFEWGDIYCRMGLLAHAAGRGTWRFGWVSQEMGYGNFNDKTLSEEKVVRHARLYRTCDVIAALLRPDRLALFVGTAPVGETEGINIGDTTIMYRPSNPALKAYKVGLMELWGCVLPAAPEDNATDLTNELGRALAGSTYVGPVPASLDRNIYNPLPNGDMPLESTYTPAPEYVPPPPSMDGSLSSFVEPTPPTPALLSSYTPYVAPDAGATAPTVSTTVVSKSTMIARRT